MNAPSITLTYVLIFIISMMNGCITPQKDIRTILTSRQTEDLRVLFWNAKDIRRLVSKHSCALWSPHQYPHAPIEVLVEGKPTLNAIIQMVFNNRMKTQVKVISMNHIIQTPIDYYHAGVSGDPYSTNIWIKPGDLIFIQAIEEIPF